MSKSNQVPLMLTVPKSCRDILRTLAAQQNLENQDRVVSAAEIAKEILCRGLEEINNGHLEEGKAMT
ncbi:MAG: hypothetical protein WCQ99_13735 [Pseudomonadota bacterium]